jgi:hypothetical protein
LCGCGSDGKCHYCNSNDFIGYIDENSTMNSTGGAFGTNGKSCIDNRNVSIINIKIMKK